MPLDIRNTASAAEGAPVALVRTIAAVMENAAEYRVAVRRRKAWEDTHISIAFHSVETLRAAGAQTGDDLHDESAEEIAEVVWEQCAAHAQENGSGEYRVTVFGEGKDGKYSELAEQVFAVSIGKDGEAAATEGDSHELVDISKLAKEIARDGHKRYMEVTEALVKISREMVTMCGPMAEAMVEMRRIDAEAAEAAATTEADARFWDTTVTASAPLINQLGSVLAAKLAEVMREGNKQPPKGKEGHVHQQSKYAIRFAEIMDSPGGDSGDRMQKILGEDLWSLVEVMRSTGDDGEFTNVARSFKTRVMAMPGYMGMMSEVSAILGDDQSKALMDLLDEVV